MNTRQLKREHMQQWRGLLEMRDRLCRSLAHNPDLGRTIAESTDLPPAVTHDVIDGGLRQPERHRKAAARRGLTPSAN
jgi:hypothetical protein